MNLGYIQITRRCNQTCRICSNPELDAAIDEELVCDFIDQMMHQGYDGVILTGGEPTTHPDLPNMIRHAKRQGIHVRIITNGQRMAEPGYAQTLVEAGLDLVHVSLLSHRPDVQNWLTGNPSSFAAVRTALQLLNDAPIALNVNIPIHHYNVAQLAEMVMWVVSTYPSVQHVVFDLCDPQQNRASRNPDVVPRLSEVRLPLKRALDWLDARGKTFRVERLPLCLMPEYAHCSTETRKIVQSEDRLIHFLDEKQTHRKETWEYGKAACCAQCDLEPICAGLWEMDKYYSRSTLSPVTGSRQAIKLRILKSA